MGTVAAGIAVIVPVKDGASRLPNLVEGLRDMFRREINAAAELILVDDGSSDESWNVISDLSEIHREGRFRIRGVRLDEGRGQQSAILAALTTCTGLRVITMDDDRSHPPSVIPLLLKGLEQGAGIVYAVPSRRPGGSFRGRVSRLHQFHMALLTGSPISVKVGSYRAMAPVLVNRVLDAPMPFPYLSAQVLVLRPRPVVSMIPTGPWPEGSGSRFSLPVLVTLEWNLTRFYGPAARYLTRRRWPSAGRRASAWIAGVTP